MEYFDISGTRIQLSAIKDFRVIDVEFIYRPVYQEVKKSMLNKLAGKKFEYVSMQPYAAIIGQEGHKSSLGEYKAKDFKEALGKDITGAVIYTIADKLKLKAFKQQKYQCLNLAGRAFTTYLDDVPVMLIWTDGRIAEVYKEDPLYETLGDVTTPGIKYVSTLIVIANETYCFYGDSVQIADATFEYERLTQQFDNYQSSKKTLKLLSKKEKRSLPSLSSVRLPDKLTEKINKDKNSNR